MKTDSFKQNMNLLNTLNESETLTEKINKDNLEINNKIQRALRSKGEARKLEPELAKHGIKVNYNNSQGTTMVGPNGKRLSDDKNHVYGPSQAGFNNTHAKTDRSYERWSKDYGNRAEEYELKLKQLKNMDRDDIIRKYNDKSTEEALKAHQAEIERIEKWAKDYRDDEKKYANDDLRARQNVKKARRYGHKNDPSSNYSHPIDKTDAPEKYNRETGKYEKSGMSSADKVDYLTYLTKKPTGYRRTGNIYRDGSEYDPADDMNKNLNQYKDLKSDESRAKEHLDFENKYYGVKSDDELKANADKMRAEVEAKIKAAQEQNEKNKKSTADAEAGVQTAKKNIQDYMKKVREDRANRTKTESEEIEIDNKINEVGEITEFKVGDIVKVPYKYGSYTPGEFTDAPIIDISEDRYVTVEIPSKLEVTMDQLKKWNTLGECDKSLTEEYSDKLGGDPEDFIGDLISVKYQLSKLNLDGFGSHLARQMVEDFIDTCDRQIEKAKRLASGDEFYTESEKINEIFETGNAIFELKFDCSNEDTYGTGIELSGNIAETLKGIAGKIESSGDTEGPIMDINGNKVGSYGLGYKDVISTIEEN